MKASVDVDLVFTDNTGYIQDIDLMLFLQVLNSLLPSGFLTVPTLCILEVVLKLKLT